MTLLFKDPDASRPTNAPYSNACLVVAEDKFFKRNKSIIHGLSLRSMDCHCEARLYRSMSAPPGEKRECLMGAPVRHRFGGQYMQVRIARHVPEVQVA